MTGSQQLRVLYPELEPFKTDLLVVGDQQIYWEVSGNPLGKPVVVLHGGPGGGSQPEYRQYFDPGKYMIVMIDQRGCGRSTPHAGDYASLANNTTWMLVEDMEKIRCALSVESWMLFGGSWGSTLALAYATTYPQHVSEMVLRGIFLLRKLEIDWFYNGGAANIFPDYWSDFMLPISAGYGGVHPVDAYSELLESADPVAATSAAIEWSRWEARTSTLTANVTRIANACQPRTARAFARIENHYFRHGAFMSDGYLLEVAERLKDTPCTIVHGRYDMVCPLANALDLKAQLPRAQLRIVPDAGHAISEPGIRHELLEATDHYARST